MCVSDILEFLAQGASSEEILEAYPFLQQEDTAAILQFSARQKRTTELLAQQWRGRAFLLTVAAADEHKTFYRG